MQHGLFADTRAQRDERKDRRTDGPDLQKKMSFVTS